LKSDELDDISSNESSDSKKFKKSVDIICEDERKNKYLTIKHRGVPFPPFFKQEVPSYISKAYS
jgi:hypothetical protein